MAATNHAEARAVLLAALGRIAAKEIAFDLLEPGEHKIDLAVVAKVDDLKILFEVDAALLIEPPTPPPSPKAPENEPAAQILHRLGPIRCNYTLKHH